jgi:hypothetical protein
MCSCYAADIDGSKIDTRSLSEATPVRPIRIAIGVGPPDAATVPRWPDAYGRSGDELQACGWETLTIHEMPNLSWHCPNSSPHICFSSGIVTSPPRDNFFQ